MAALLQLHNIIAQINTKITIDPEPMFNQFSSLSFNSNTNFNNLTKNKTIKEVNDNVVLHIQESEFDQNTLSIELDKLKSEIDEYTNESSTQKSLAAVDDCLTYINNLTSDTNLWYVWVGGDEINSTYNKVVDALNNNSYSFVNDKLTHGYWSNGGHGEATYSIGFGASPSTSFILTN